MEKRGQFYLIAAIVIVGVLIGIVTVSNFVVEHNKNYNFLDLQDELKLESENVINYGVYDDEDLSLLLENFAENYAEYIGENQDVLFVYGNEETLSETPPKVYWVSLFNVQSQISLTIGGSKPSLDINVRELSDGNVEVNGEIVLITIDDVNYEFELKEGNNFFFVVREGESE